MSLGSSGALMDQDLGATYGQTIVKFRSVGTLLPAPYSHSSTMSCRSGFGASFAFCVTLTCMQIAGSELKHLRTQASRRAHFVRGMTSGSSLDSGVVLG